MKLENTDPRVPRLPPEFHSRIKQFDTERNYGGRLFSMFQQFWFRFLWALYNDENCIPSFTLGNSYKGEMSRFDLIQKLILGPEYALRRYEYNYSRKVIADEIDRYYKNNPNACLLSVEIPQYGLKCFIEVWFRENEKITQRSCCIFLIGPCFYPPPPPII